MRHIYLTLALVIPALMISNAQEVSKKDLVDQVLDVSGADVQLDQVSGALSQALTAQKERFDEETFVAFEEAMTNAYQTERLKAQFKKTFEEKMDSKSLEGILAWYSSDIAKKIIQLEMDASTPEGVQRMQTAMAKMNENPISKKRKKLISKLDKFSGATVSALDMVIGTTYGVMMGVNSLLEEENQMSEAQLNELFVAMRMQMYPITQVTTQLALTTVYDPLTDDELKQYIKFLKSKAGKKFTVGIQWGMNTAYRDAAQVAGTEMARLFVSE